MAFELSSPAFKEGGMIPLRHSCKGEDLSPPLQWGEAPPGTKSFALTMEDPDAPKGVWVHWVAYGIPATLSSLPGGISPGEALPTGGLQGMASGFDTFSALGYRGPCPPFGTHHYVFRLFALDRTLRLKPKADVFELRKAMKGHVLGQAVLTGIFKK